MKRLYAALLAVCLLLGFCSCTASGVDFSEGSEVTVSSDGAFGLGQGIVFGEEFDGLAMTVITDKDEYDLNDIINVRTVLKNTSDRDIDLYYGYSVPPDIARMQVNIDGMVKSPPDPKGADLMVVVIPVRPGEEYIQDTRFWLDEGNKPSVSEARTYNGKCSVNICGDLTCLGGIVERAVEFSVKLK